MAGDAEQIRASVVSRYGRLTEAAAGQRVTDCGPGEACFGAAAYDDADGLPEGALRASLGCGNPVAVAALNHGEAVLDPGSGGGIDVLVVGPAGRPVRGVYGLDGVINLSADKPRVLAEAFRVLRPGGRLGVSDVIASDDTDPDQRAAAEARVGCTTGIVTVRQYRDQLLAPGFT